MPKKHNISINIYTSAKNGTIRFEVNHFYHLQGVSKTGTPREKR